MDHCTVTFPLEDVTWANKHPVIHGMIITYFMSANYKMSPFLSTNGNGNKRTDYCCVCLTACAANGSDCDDNGIFFFHAGKNE